MTNPWAIDESDFYELETRKEQLEFLVRYAILAPSGHNMQPWSFRITSDSVEVFADTSRRMLIVDRNDRELLMSIGAAITNFRVAAAHFGFDTTVAYETRSLETLPAATILTCETCSPNRELATRFPAIRERHTNRESYANAPLEPAALQAILDVVEANPTALQLVLPRDKERVAACVEDAERALMARPAYCAELTDMIGRGAKHVFSRDVELARNASVLLALTSDDDPVALIRAGEALELLLLTITKCGLHYSILSAPAAMAEPRQRLQHMIRSPRAPQLLVRIGTAVATAKPSPRRAAASVIV